MSDWLASGSPRDLRSIGTLRSMVHGLLPEELEAIDRLVEPLLQSSQSD